MKVAQLRNDVFKRETLLSSLIQMSYNLTKQFTRRLWNSLVLDTQDVSFLVTTQVNSKLNLSQNKFC
jgi:hypothetical protein